MPKYEWSFELVMVLKSVTIFKSNYNTQVILKQNEQ